MGTEFVLIFSGLCAMVLSPCGGSPTTLTAVFPKGNFEQAATLHHDAVHYPEHLPMLLVDPVDVDPSSTMQPIGILEEPAGNQFAVYKLKGRIELRLDGAADAPKVKLGSNFDKVVKLSEVIKNKSDVGKLRSDVFSTKGNKYASASLVLPLDPSGASLDAFTRTGVYPDYDFHNGAKPVADRAKAMWTVNQEVVFTDRKGRILKLRDPAGGDGQIKVVLSSFADHIQPATDDLEHFPLYYFLAEKNTLKALTDDERRVPKKVPVPLGGEGAKPVACALCEGCG